MIYVDKLKQHGSREWCHLVTDGTLTELHAFAKKIGCKAEWFQPKSSPHYDLSPYMRFKAVNAGASEISGRKLAELVATMRTKREEKQAVKAQFADQKSDY